MRMTDEIQSEDTPVIMLGNRVEDVITGFQGIAIARSQHLYGCTHIHIKPETLRDGKIQASEIVDLARCQFVEVALGQPDGNPPVPALGTVVSDKITGFAGIVIVTQEHLYEPVQVCVESCTLHDGKPIEPHWFVGARLNTVDNAEKIPAAARGLGASTATLPT
jgi:hypothetical protein